MLLSICIPTFNRAKHLDNCLSSILTALRDVELEVEVCISDNCSTDNTEQIVLNSKLPVIYKKNSENIGIARNFLSAVGLASGEFVWLIGDDDLLLPDSIGRLGQLIKDNSRVDFFYVNAYHLSVDYVLSHPQPFSVANSPENMEKFSNYSVAGDLPFWGLIDRNKSFDFLGGIFLVVFRRSGWQENINALPLEKLDSRRQFSNVYNTFPHSIIFAKAFGKSPAYFCTQPHIICLTGARTWAPMYKMIKSIRMVQLLEIYSKYGMPWIRYVKCRNDALQTYIPDLVWMILNKKISGFEYLNFRKDVLANALYPNTYLSLLFFLGRKALLMLLILKRFFKLIKQFKRNI